MDLLNKIGGNRSVKGELLDEDNVELSLGLSSNGQFGVDRRLPVANWNDNRLVRCSSIADLSSESADPTSMTMNPLMRTCSLPVETEAEWKKRKELQTLRRSEAKRKRVEKIKSGRVVVVKGMVPEEGCEVKKRRSPSLLPPLPRPAVAPAQVAVGSPASGGSSGVSDLECQPSAGTNKETELKSTATQQPVPHQMSSSNPHISNSIPSHTTASQTINGNLARDEALKTLLADMPCVTTKGDGVNAMKIEGFLYRYKKGEEVTIVCVCHGNFFTPAEFVKHGGGGDVEHPLKHIVVMPPTL